jgi:hypothetical protein
VRADKRPSSWSGLRGRLSTKRGNAEQNSVTPVEASVVDQWVVPPRAGAEYNRSLDLMANWTTDQPTMSQMMDGQANQEVLDTSRQSGDAMKEWGTDNAGN